MNDLSRHLIEAGGHAHLPFHLNCPACREERLAGDLQSAPLVSPRASAGLVAAVLATSTLPPAVLTTPAAAVEEDHGQDGSAPPGAGAPAGEGFAPGEGSGASTPLPDSPGSVGADDGAEPGEDEAGPVEPVGADDAPGPDGDLPIGVSGSSPGPDTGPGGRPVLGKGEPAKPRGGGSQRNGSDTNTDAAGGRDGGAPTDGKRRSPRHRGQGQQHVVDLEPRRAVERVRQDMIGGDAGASLASDSRQERAPVTGSEASSLASLNSGTRPSASATDSQSEFHVVRPGQSLWSIAADLLGERATNAAVAREVERLWTLNAAAIGTGDPDLLKVGQRLRLQ